MDLGLLTRKWVHSHEEDTPQAMVFRPAAYDFPPSRGRRSFELHPGGALTGESIGPDDRKVASQGTWAIGGGDELNLNWNDPAGRLPTMKIKEATPDKLVVIKSA